MPRPTVIAVVDRADRDFRAALHAADVEDLELVALFRFLAIRDRESIALALSGPPTEAEREQLGHRAEAIAEQMRRVADALHPPIPPDADVLRIVIDFAPGADPAAVIVLARDLTSWARGPAFPYGAQPPRVTGQHPASPAEGLVERLATSGPLEVDPLGPTE